MVAVHAPYSGKRLERFKYRLNIFDYDLKFYVSKLKQIKNVIVCGDFNVSHENIDVYNP